MACDSDCVLGGGELVVRIPRDAYKDYPSLIIGSEWPSIPIRESSSAIHSLKTVMLAATGGSLAWKLSLQSPIVLRVLLGESGLSFGCACLVVYSTLAVMHFLCGMAM